MTSANVLIIGGFTPGSNDDDFFPLPPTSDSGGGNNDAAIAGGVIGGIIVALALYFYIKNQKEALPPPRPMVWREGSHSNPLIQAGDYGNGPDISGGGYTGGGFGGAAGNATYQVTESPIYAQEQPQFNTRPDSYSDDNRL